MDVRESFFDGVVAPAEAAVGHALDGRTVVCPDPSRAGGGPATSYPTPAGTVVWCEPSLVGTITDLLGSEARTPITTDRWIELATAAGAEHLGSGNNRVLVEDLRRPVNIESGIEARRLDREVEADVTTLARFADTVSAADRDAAELDVDDLDPFIVGLFDGDTMVAYASGLPDDRLTDFDDIGVITHAEHRRRGLGALVVAEFVERRTASDPSRQMLYRCDVDNIGSNAVAESLGFELVQTIGAVRFP